MGDEKRVEAGIVVEIGGRTTLPNTPQRRLKAQS